ncbi:hypothetical protein C8Q77DRAFT_855118 [Trametes polyzona]|nr:hypothetical protein C8Q77DRAFT_855118 [Trametes polyzona]
MPLLGATVEASREKRIERQQARFRDRGGIFRPAEHNPLLDILLARGVNGESPSRANSPRRSRSRSASPNRKHRDGDRSPTRNDTTSAPNRHSRKSLGKRRKSEAQGGEHVEEAEEEKVAGPSKATSKSNKSRATKGAGRKSRVQTTQPESDEQRDRVVVKAASKPKVSRKNAKQTKSEPNADPTTKAKRAPKRKATAPDPDPTATKKPAADDLMPNDDEPLVPRKRGKTKTTKPKASGSKPRTHEPVEMSEDERAPPEPVKRRGVAKKAQHPDSTNSTVEVDEQSPHRPLATTKPPDKGKRKAGPTVGQDAPDPEPTAPLTKTKRTKRAVIESDSDAEAAESSIPPKRKRVTKGAKEPEPAPIPPVDSTATEGDNTPQPKRASDKRLVAVLENDTPLVSRRRELLDAFSSPDIPLAKTILRKRTTSRRQLVPTDDNNQEVEAAEDDASPPPRKRRRPPEDKDNSATASQEKVKVKRHVLVSPIRKVSRSRAPPVYAPKGAVLKPKPKPRLSILPKPPPAGEESDEDPIDLLS